MSASPAAASYPPRFSLMLGAATLGHAALLSLTLRATPHVPQLALPWVELEVIAAPEARGQRETQATSVPGDPGFAPATAHAARAGATTTETLDTAEERTAIGDPSLDSALSEDNPAPSSAGTPRAPVRLFLNGPQLSKILERSPMPDTRPAPTDLWQPLRAEEAERGLSPASPAIVSGYRSAQLGPSDGTAVFEVHVNAQGIVDSVRVVGNVEHEAWHTVARDLLKRLQEKPLRLPNQAQGMVFRLRIDRGALATDIKDRYRTEPGVALGQDEPPRGVVRDNSQKATFEESGRISPAARAFDSSWLSGSGKTRIQLESLRPL